MLIKVLTENTKVNDSLECEHGLSLYIETNGKKMLFDCGQTGLFFENAKKMGVDISDVDLVVISHGHYDHTGGLKTFLQNNEKALIYMNENAFMELYRADGTYIGIDQTLKGNDRIVLVGDEYKIDENMNLYSMNNKKRKYETQSKNLLAKTENGKEEDSYIHEHYLTVNENGKTILISGCSHKGILNIMDFFEEYNVDTFIGGLHLRSVEDKSVLDTIANELSNKNVTYFTGHCTGVEQYEYLKQKMGKHLEYISTGKTINI